eukprot:scaffold7060_cov280-Pinguiococcus_pyrenoidosus.AAC.1
MVCSNLLSFPPKTHTVHRHDWSGLQDPHSAPGGKAREAADLGYRWARTISYHHVSILSRGAWHRGCVRRYRHGLLQERQELAQVSKQTWCMTLYAHGSGEEKNEAAALRRHGSRGSQTTPDTSRRSSDIERYAAPSVETLLVGNKVDAEDTREVTMKQGQGVHRIDYPRRRTVMGRKLDVLSTALFTQWQAMALPSSLCGVAFTSLAQEV